MTPFNQKSMLVCQMLLLEPEWPAVVNGSSRSGAPVAVL
jgi:hypothetical protein